MDISSLFPSKICAVIFIIIVIVQGRTLPLVPKSITNKQSIYATTEVTSVGETTKAEPPVEDSDEAGSEILDDCIMLTAEQKTWIEESNADETINSIHNPKRSLGSDDVTTRHRQKRKVTNFRTHPHMRWRRFPIIYKFDGKHTYLEQKIIRNAIAHWMDHTCVTFREVDYHIPVSDNHVLFTKSDSGRQKCYSNVGMVYLKPQKIILDYACLWEFGTAVHEIGHTLGLWHEHMRFDRDDYIRINWAEVGNAHAWFKLITATESLGVPYDYASVMHYSPRDAAVSGGNVLEARDPLFQSTMGQRTGLSYADAQIINKAYCSDVCRTPLPKQCSNGGYQDPLHCERCRCPDGLSGTYCEDVAPSARASCGGLIQLDPSSATTISSPGYERPGYYDNRVECNWLVRAPPGYHVRLTFIEEFGLYCHQQRECYHWVEVRFAGSIGDQGPRFCCENRPQQQLTSFDEDMLVVFRSNWTSRSTFARRGFKARLEAVASGNGDRPSTTTRSPDTTTPTTTMSTTTTISSTSPTTTTATTTTPVPTISSTSPIVSTTRKSGSFQWSCGFESPATGEDHWMGMEQSTVDQFDWTLWTGPTPSDETGPDGAYSGRYYVYIEASEPRLPGEQALLWLPNFQLQGSYCLRFHYHMFGYHINELRLLKVGDNANIDIVWREQGEQGSHWLEGRVQLILHSTDRVGFVGVRGNEFSGDIALDDIVMTEGDC